MLALPLQLLDASLELAQRGRVSRVRCGALGLCVGRSAHLSPLSCSLELGLGSHPRDHATQPLGLGAALVCARLQRGQLTRVAGRQRRFLHARGRQRRLQLATMSALPHQRARLLVELSRGVGQFDPLRLDLRLQLLFAQQRRVQLLRALEAGGALMV